MTRTRGGWWTILAMALSLVVGGCGDDDGGDTPGTGTDSGVLTDAGGGMDSGGATDSGGAIDSGGETDSGGNDAGGGNDGGEGTACSQAPEDEPCAQCTCSMCPEAVETCYADPACATYIECVSACTSGDFACLLGCGTPPSSGQDLLSCATDPNACGSAC